MIKMIITLRLHYCSLFLLNNTIMLASNNFQTTNITINGKEFKMEYDLATTINTDVRVFGNIYINPERPTQFTIIVTNNKIAGYTPMNGTKEFIGSIVQ